MIGEILLIIFAFALVITGATGIILPFLPGVPISWLGMLLFGYATDFNIVTGKILIIFFIFTIFTMLLDGLAPLIGAKKYKTSSYGLMGAIIGLFLGLAVAGPVGVILGPFLGVFIAEVLTGKMENEAMESAKGTIIGALVGSAIKLAVVSFIFGYMIFALINNM